MSRLSRISLLLAFFFAADKVVALLRQVIIARQFGLSAELDAFNVANNMPDLLFALISGGALAMAFIPVLTELLTSGGREAAWRLFSRIANLAFLVTAGFAIIIAIFAGQLVRWEIGIAPGFGPEQQELVISLMRWNLVATMIFSISGLVMAGLQANQHFLFPAMAPILYNVGQIFGALVLSPEKGVVIGPFQLPALGMGIHGLVYGVILGACLHLGIQIPVLLKFHFRWQPGIVLHDKDVLKVLRVLGPRLATVFMVQLIFIVRDNLASRLAEGSVTALTYGWMIQQLPETLIGTAIGTAILPTLAEYVTKHDAERFQETVQKATRIGTSLAFPIGGVLAVGLGPVITAVFGFDGAESDLLLWTTRGYLVGLIGHCLLEVAARSFYSQQNAIAPLLGGIINLTVYIIAGSQLYQWLGAPGVSLTDSLAFTTQAVVLLILLGRKLKQPWRQEMVSATNVTGSDPRPTFTQRLANGYRTGLGLSDQKMTARVTLIPTILRGLTGAIIAGLLTWLVPVLAVNTFGQPIAAMVGMIVGIGAALPFMLPEFRLLRGF